MALTFVHIVLNLAALLLWLNWLLVSRETPSLTPANSLVSTLRKAGSKGIGRWKFLAGMALLILLRAVAYWQIGPMLKWTPRLEWGVINLTFGVDDLFQMVIFSILSFLAVLGVFYLWLLLLSVANKSVPDTDALQKLVRYLFKWLEPWPAWLKLPLPLFAGGLLWIGLHPLLSLLAVAPPVKSGPQLCEQAMIVSAGGYLAWKYLIVSVLILHLVNSYVHLGNSALWGFVNVTARNLLRPLQWLPAQIGRVDFLPLIGVALVFLVTEFIANPSAWPPALRPWFYRLMAF